MTRWFAPAILGTSQKQRGSRSINFLKLASAMGLGIALALSVTVELPFDLSLAENAYAQVDLGRGKIEGQVNVPMSADPDIRQFVVDVINFIVNFVALAAVIAIIVAGFYLLMGFGTETSSQKARKIILYAVIGIIVIFFSKIIVNFILGALSGNSGAEVAPTPAT